MIHPRTLLTLLALTSTASASTAALHVFPPAGETLPVSLSLTTPLTQAQPVNLALRSDLLLLPGLNAPPAVSALLIAEGTHASGLISYAGLGLGTAAHVNAGTWTAYPSWTAVAGMRRTEPSGLGVSVEARASRTAVGLSVGLTYDLPRSGK